MEVRFSQGDLETAADATTGKVLCVCAAAAIARLILTTRPGSTPRAFESLELLERWIDDPETHFESICSLIFDHGEPSDFDPYGVLWFALRTATSSVGNSEAGWALASTCSAAKEAGFTPLQLHEAVASELMKRCQKQIPGPKP